MSKEKFKLPRKVARAWVKALRSGKYNQGQSYLYNRDTDGYCCLGVLCMVKAKLHKKSPTIWGGETGGVSKKQRAPGYISYRLMPKEEQDIFVNKNDTLGWPFKRIATFIEKRYL